MNSEELSRRGFNGWMRFNRAGETTLLLSAPNAPGVYCIRSTTELFSFTHGQSDILYIGSAANRGGIRNRLRQYLHPGHAQPTNKRMLARCGEVDCYEIAFTATSTPQGAKALESELLIAFVAEHGERPPENKNVPRNWRSAAS
jgi:hypothetical protein